MISSQPGKAITGQHNHRSQGGYIVEFGRRAFEEEQFATKWVRLEQMRRECFEGCGMRSTNRHCLWYGDENAFLILERPSYCPPPSFNYYL